jgi:hypothetical protein
MTPSFRRSLFDALRVAFWLIMSVKRRVSEDFLEAEGGAGMTGEGGGEGRGRGGDLM